MRNFENKEKILELMREVLESERRIVFAYAYGSFLKEEKFRDIDLGIFLEDLRENPFKVTSNIKVKLSQLARENGLDFKADQFDVQVINEAPFTFLGRIFNEGMLLLDRDPDLRTDIIERVSLKYRECAGLLAEAGLI